MADYLPLFYPGQVITRTASAAITGGQLVRVSGDGTVGPSGAASADWLGVAAFDAANGELVTVWSGGVQRVIAAGAITAGANVISAAAGKVAAGAAAAGTAVGIALTGAADGALAEVMFLR